MTSGVIHTLLVCLESTVNLFEKAVAVTHERVLDSVRDEFKQFSEIKQGTRSGRTALEALKIDKPEDETPKPKVKWGTLDPISAPLQDTPLSGTNKPHTIVPVLGEFPDHQATAGGEERKDGEALSSAEPAQVPSPIKKLDRLFKSPKSHDGAKADITNVFYAALNNVKPRSHDFEPCEEVFENLPEYQSHHFCHSSWPYTRLQREAYELRCNINNTCDEFDQILSSLLLVCLILIVLPTLHIAKDLHFHWHFYFRGKSTRPFSGRCS